MINNNNLSNIDTKAINKLLINTKKMSNSKSAFHLLAVASRYNANDVMEYTSNIKNSDKSEYRENEKTTPTSVIVIDSKMTPLEAATLLWENNM